MKKYFSVILAFLIFQFFACSRDELKSIENEPKFPVDISKKIEVINGSIYKNNQVIQLKGVNALNSFGISKNGRMKEWNVEIVREFIGNLREQPISGGAINDAQGQFLHSLDSIVIEHRKNNRITIICPFGWVDNNGNQTLFTGKNPSEMSFYDGYKSKLKSIASFFKDQEDVWIQTWNEPYHFKNENGYSHELWLKDSREMVENLRSINGFTNIIVVPGNEQGQGETALLEKGELLLTDYSNILFDLHAYGKWHDNASLESLKMRLFKLQVKKLPFLFGEVGVVTEGAPLSNPINFLEACDELSIGALAWLWNTNTEDQNSLLTDEGQPNNTNNFNWGTTFKTFLENN